MKNKKLSVYAIHNTQDEALPTFVTYVIVKGKLSSNEEREITRAYRKFWDENKTFTGKEFLGFFENQFKKYDCEIIDLHPCYGEIYVCGRVNNYGY